MPHSTHTSGPSPAKLIRQCVVTGHDPPLDIISTPYPQPGPNDIAIRNRYVAIHPYDLGYLDMSTHHLVTIDRLNSPRRDMDLIVLGTDVSGVVEAVGDRVTTFKVGDAVMAHCNPEGGKQAAFQDITVVPASLACHKPTSWSFAEAATIPTAYKTACDLLSSDLLVPLPHLLPRPHPPTPNTDLASEYLSALRLTDAPAPPAPIERPPAPPLNSVLVLGGATPLGAVTTQLLRASLAPGTAIISDDARAPGATAYVPSLASSSAAELIAAVRPLTPAGEGVDGVMDATGEMDGEDERGRALWGVGASQRMREAMLFEEEGYKVRVFSIEPEFVGGWETVDAEAMRGLGELAEEGKMRVPWEVEVVGRGLEGVAGGLERLRGDGKEAGMRGKVLVVAL